MSGASLEMRPIGARNSVQSGLATRLNRGSQLRLDRARSALWARYSSVHGERARQECLCRRLLPAQHLYDIAFRLLAGLEKR
jgi:hypothetical protein